MSVRYASRVLVSVAVPLLTWCCGTSAGVATDAGGAPALREGDAADGTAGDRPDALAESGTIDAHDSTQDARGLDAVALEPTGDGGLDEAWLRACQDCAGQTPACRDERCLRCLFEAPPLANEHCGAGPTSFQIESFAILNADCPDACSSR